MLSRKLQRNIAVADKTRNREMIFYRKFKENAMPGCINHVMHENWESILIQQGLQTDTPKKTRD